MTPFEILDIYDFSLVYLAGLCRFMLVIQYKATEQVKKGREFEFSKYFDIRHRIRWSGHFLVSTVLLISIPEIFEVYVAEVYLDGYGWSYLGSFIVGFYGYDLVKLLEKITLPLVNKIFKL